MSQWKSESSASEKEAQLPKRDFFLLPAISFLTILTILVASEVVCRLIWPEDTNDVCVVSDPLIHTRFRPNCKSRTKPAEGPWSDNLYNDVAIAPWNRAAPNFSGYMDIVIALARLMRARLPENFDRPK